MDEFFTELLGWIWRRREIDDPSQFWKCSGFCRLHCAWWKHAEHQLAVESAFAEGEFGHEVHTAVGTSDKGDDSIPRDPL